MLNETCQTIYSLYQAKEITEKVYTIMNNIMNSIILWHKMDNTFVNSENSETSYAHRISLSLSDEMNLKRSDKCVTLWNLGIY